MIKAILFDYDDTLVKTRDSKWSAIRETGKRFFNLDIDNNHIAKFWGLPFEEMLTTALKNADSFENLRDKYYEVTTEFPMEVHLNALETVSGLLKKYLVGIVTASNKKLVIDDLKKLNFPISEFFAIQTAEDTLVHKPDPKVFDKIIQKLKKEKNISKQEILYIGDGLKDWFAARDAGLKFIGITHGTTTLEEFKNVGADSIDNFSDLWKRLE